MSAKHEKQLKRSTHVIIVAILVMAAVSVILMMKICTPMAKTSTGAVVEEPYSMLVDGREVMLVASEEDGKKALEEATDTYVPEGASKKTISYDKNIEFKKKEVKPFKKLDVVLSEEEAAREIIDRNNDTDPLFTATVAALESTEKKVEPKVRFEYNEDMKMFEYKIKQEGKEGTKKITYEVTAENGSIVSKEKADTTIVEEAQDAVIETGYEEAPDGIRWDDYEEYQDEIEEENTDYIIGEKMVEFAKKFLGNPYKRGGNDLENGIDCTGFVVEIYKKWGITMKRSVNGKNVPGEEVELKDAKPGDLVFYGNHTAMYMGDGKVIHARKRGVSINDIDYKKWVCIKHIDKKDLRETTE